jgi:putative ABC transport system permease protein
MILTSAAAVLALTLVIITLPAFNHLTSKELSLNPATLRWLLPSLTGIIATLGLFSGAWPAFFLSGFRPINTLKGKLVLSKNSNLRNILVTLQFTISIFLIVGTLVVYRQLSFIQHRDPGYDRSQVLVLKDLDGVHNPGVLKKQMLALPGVTNATLTGFLPTNDHRWHNWGDIPGSHQASLETQLWVVDEDYIPTMGMQMAQGRNFSHELTTDSNGIILNETAARMFGIANDPLNKTVHYAYYLHHPTSFTVIGVVKDFNFTSVRTSVTPLVLINRPADDGTGLNLRIAAGQLPATLARIKATWSAYAPNIPFNYSFMREDFDAIYRAEERMSSVVLLLTALAIGIACLGLFGLATYAAEQRAKEIGIRKVLGATIPSIVTLLSKDFGRLIFIAILIATPIAWLAMTNWLQTFAYRTTIGPWPFITAAIIIATAAAATTIWQSLKAAVTNPVESLRNE